MVQIIRRLKCRKFLRSIKKKFLYVTGAGDTVVAAFTLALCAGMSAKEAMVVGNLAASIVIRQFGCHTTNLEELKNRT